MAIEINPGDSVELEQNQMLTLKWFAGGGIHHLEIFPVPVGNMGSKHVLYQPELMSGSMAFAPLTSGDIFGVFYRDAKTKAEHGTAVFHVTVKGTHGFLFSMLAVSGSGSRRWAPDKLEVDIGEPVTFFWKAGAGATHGNLTGVGKVDPAAGKATVIVKESGDYTLSLDGGDSASADQQTISISCSQNTYDGYYDSDAQQLIQGDVHTAGVALGGTDPDLIEGYWLTGGDGVAKWSTQIEKGKSVTLHWRVKDSVNHVEIYDGKKNLDKVPDPTGGGDFDLEVDPPPDADTDYILTAFAQKDFESGYKFARGVVHVGVHGEGEEVSEHRSNLPNLKFEASHEFEIFKSPPANVLKYFKWQVEFGIKLEGTVAFEGTESGPALELGSTNGKTLGMAIVKKYAEGPGLEHNSPHFMNLTNVEGTVVEYDRKEGKVKVGAIKWTWGDGKLEGSVEVGLLEVPVKAGEFKFVYAEGELTGGWGPLEFELSEHIKLGDVKVQPYAKLSAWLDWIALGAEVVKDAAEDGAEEAGTLAGAEVALVGGALLMSIATVALVVMAIYEAADLVELGKEVTELTGDAKRGYLDAIAGSTALGGYWYQRGHAAGEKAIAERKAALQAVPQNQQIDDFDAAWDKTFVKYKKNFESNDALQKVIDAAKLSLWNGFGPKYMDSHWSHNEQKREWGWYNVYGHDPADKNERQLFHKFDDVHTDFNSYGAAYKKTS